MFYKLINYIKTNLNNNNNKFIVNVNKTEKKLLNILIKFNIIKFIIKKNKKYIIILNKLKKNKKIFNIVNFYKPSNFKTIKSINIKKINKKNKILIISSNKGLVDNFYSEKNKIGGLVLLYIWN